MNTHSPITLAAALLALATPNDAVRAQQVTEGLAATTLALPATTSLALQTQLGRVEFDGAAVTLLAPGQPPRQLLALTGLAFGSFLLQTDATHVLFGCTGSQDVVWLLPLQGPGPAAPVATVTLNYDAAVLTPTRALVSAKAGGFSTPNNDLLVVDLASGSVQPVASIPGASGPVTTTPNGDVYYATSSLSFPTPPGLVQILRFRRPVLDAAIASNTVLTPAQAELVWSGLDTASDLAFDDDGDLVFVDWMNARVAELSDVDGPLPSRGATIVDYSAAATSPATLQFAAGTGTGSFEPFQPANGTLLVLETDFFSTSQLRSLRSAPATLTATGVSPIPAGAFGLVTTAGPALGIGLIAFDISAAAGTIPITIPGFEQPLWWSNALLQTQVLILLPFDASGGAVLNVVNPGFAPAIAATAQVAHVSTLGVLGATNPLPLLIAQ